MTNPPKKPLKDMTTEEILNRDVQHAAWGDTIGKRPPKGERGRKVQRFVLNDPETRERQALIRVGTRNGDPGARLCTKIKKDGVKCRSLAVRGEPFCLKHLTSQGQGRLKARRLEEGRPIGRMASIAKSNLKNVVRQNKVPYELTQQPIFQAIMQVVAPQWYGKPKVALGRRLTRRDLGDAALLGREMVLAWISAVDGGEHGNWTLWSNVVMKARALGYISPEQNPFS